MTITNEQQKQLRSLLDEEMQDIQDRRDANDGYGTQDSMRVELGELSMYDNHPGDIGSEMFERGKDIALREHDSIRLQEISEAMNRMEDGSYGTCQHCGTDIPFERLEANPAALYCVTCQENADEREVSANRPVEENFLYPGFGRTFLDDQDQTGYDGEDAWQDVAKYGTATGNDDSPYAMKPKHYYTDSDERVGYVEDIEGFVITDITGRPVSDPSYVRNEAYQRAWDEANSEEYTAADHYNDPR